MPKQRKPKPKETYTLATFLAKFFPDLKLGVKPK